MRRPGCTLRIGTVEKERRLKFSVFAWACVPWALLLYNTAMKDLPIGMHTFSDIIKDNFLYVDKTRDIYTFLAERGKYYFLSRPRRFGKSLLISTLKEIFLGNKELFKGLWIYDKMEWQEYPVIHLDFMNISLDTPDILKESLRLFVYKIAGQNKISLAENQNYKQAFVELIEKLYTSRGKIVILIDEYDKPIIDFIENQEIASQNQVILKNFYATLKGLEGCLKFVFITGVSRFSRVSILSDLNNLRDITLNSKYATLLGYTQEELLRYFDDRLDHLTRKHAESKVEWLQDIKTWYNGIPGMGKILYTILILFCIYSRRADLPIIGLKPGLLPSWYGLLKNIISTCAKWRTLKPGKSCFHPLKSMGCMWLRCCFKRVI